MTPTAAQTVRELINAATSANDILREVKTSMTYKRGLDHDEKVSLNESLEGIRELLLKTITAAEALLAREAETDDAWKTVLTCLLRQKETQAAIIEELMSKHADEFIKRMAAKHPDLFRALALNTSPSPCANPPLS